MNSTPALTFKSKTFEVVDQHGQAWLTLSDIASALYRAEGGDQSGPPSANAIRQVQKLYQRHADEFTAGMTAMIEKATSGGKQLIRIFSLRGAHLLAMFARTPVAKEFRAWVLDILDRQAGRSREERLEDVLSYGRWLMTMRDGRLVLKPIADDAMVVTSSELPGMMADPCSVSIRDLPAVIAAASARLTPWIASNLPARQP